MIETYYNWFELEIHTGLYFYPNWEINLYNENSFISILVFINNFFNLTDTNVRSYKNIKSILDNLDILYIINNLNTNAVYLNYVLISDLFILNNINELKLNLTHSTDGLNYITSFIFLDSNFVYILNDFIFNKNIIKSFTYSTQIIYDSFITSTLNTVLNVLWFFFIFICLFIVFTLVNVIIRNTSMKFNINFTVSRLFFYFYNFSKETRINFELLIQFMLFLIFSWLFNLMSFDDINVEIIELFHLTLFYFFIFIIVYLLFKYSLHYFAFLEATVTEGKNSSFILKQFVRDISNTFALFLRFFLLLFRLNVYDGLDDFLDSYCLFFYDFDEDNNFNDNIINLSKNDFTFDNNADLDIQDKEQTIFWFNDLYKIYLIYFFEILYFLIFILEELFRLSLALYITYLIIFEVHSVNCSYTEDNYILSKKSKNF